MNLGAFKKLVIDRTTHVLDVLEARLIAGQRKAKRAGGETPAPRVVAKVSNFGRTALALSMSVLLLGAFIYGVSYFSTTIRIMEDNPLVVNLNAQDVKTRVHFGLSPCEDLKPECFSAANFNDKDWDEVNVPRITLQNFPGYKEGKTTGWVWYRFRVPVSEAQIESGEELAFTPIYVFHDHYRVWVEGRLVDVGNTGPQTSTVLKVALPREDLTDGEAIVVVRGSVSDGEKGINHFRSLYVGPRSAIEQVHVLRERSLVTYFLLFLATKGSIFVVFTLFFFFSKERRALFAFLIYGFFVTVENLLAGDFLTSYVEPRYLYALYFLGKTAAITALGTFAAEYVQAFRARTLLRNWHRFMAVVVLAACAEMVIKNVTGYVTTTELFHLTNTFLVLNLTLALVLGLLALRQWMRAAVDPRRAVTLRWFIGVVAVYLGLLMWEFLGNQFFGFDKRAVFDLLFFFYMAFVTAKEFGFNQGQVITLEAHMSEKRRMEAELQEAALISKAFLPGTAPRWDFCDIAIFHRPLSETSGDWYTFEEGPAGRYAHVLLCDITGHGVQAALVVSTCRAVLSALIAEHPEAADAPDFVAHYARSLNNILFRQGGGFHVTTLLGLTLDRETGKVHFLACGHPLPLLIGAGAAGGAARTIKPLISRSDPLGVSAGGTWVLSDGLLKAGDELLAYTDGLPAQTGIKGLKRFLDSRPDNAPLVPESLFEAVCEAEKARGRPTADDDVSVIWIRWGAPSTSRLTDPLKSEAG